MKELTYKDLTFVPYIEAGEIAKQVQRVADEIKRDAITDNPLFICTLKGAFIFAADLFRACNLPHAEMAFMRFKSYQGTSSTGTVTQVNGLLDDNLEGREVIIIEDIVDTGVTAQQMRATLAQSKPKSVKMASLLFKPGSLTVGNPPEYVGFEIPSKFIIGYGLDLDGEARNLPDIYILKDQLSK